MSPHDQAEGADILMGPHSNERQSSEHPVDSVGFLLPLSSGIHDDDISDALSPIKDAQLDLYQIPKYLLPIVRRNASESPLLKLSGEVRNLVWDHVTDDLRVHLLYWGFTNNAKSKSKETIVFDRPQAGYGNENLTVPTFRSLPRVSRQVYAETHQYLYTRATYRLEGSVRFKLPNQTLSPNQSSAVRILELTHVNQNRCNFKNTHFPNLEKIVVRPWRQPLQLGGSIAAREAQRRTLTEEWVRKVQGGEVEVEFRYSGQSKAPGMNMLFP